MKRRLAFLLALSLTFASFPVTGAGAAENTEATATQVVTEAEQEEISGEGASVEEETVDPTNEVKEETAGTSGSENGQETTQTKEETVNTEAVSDENTTNENTGVVEDAAAEFTEDATTGLTDTEVAAVVEPEEVVAAEEVKQAAATTPATTTNKVQPHWVSSGGDWYYVTDTGANATGFLSVQGVRYYFYSDGKMATGWVYDAGSWYYFKDSGAMRTGWLYDDGEWYFLDTATGKMAKGFKDVDGVRYYFYNNGKMATGWVYDAGSWYYFNGSGAMRRGWLYDGGKWYLLDAATGKMAKGFRDVDGARYYFYNNGAMATGWVYDAGSWYYFKGSGAMVKGWVYDAGSWYFCDTTTGKMRTGWLLDRGTWYFLYRDGSMATGWDLLGGKWYYFNSSGAMATGWVYSKGEWYYMNSAGVMLTHWQEINGNWYYLDPSSGVMASAPRYCTSAWTSRTNNYYFFYEDGRLGTGKGWKKNGGYWYYTNADGILYRNTSVDGYYLDDKGRWGDVMDNKAQGYSSNTNYLILVDKSTYTVRIYKGSKGSWSRIKSWDCTHGGSNTPNGVWVIDDHVTKRDATWGWADFDYSSAAFACHISAGNYFHTILFEKGTRGNPYNQPIRDGNLRRNYSNGCIRLKIENAEWVWDNIPFGTKVVVYNS